MLYVLRDSAVRLGFTVGSDAVPGAVIALPYTLGWYNDREAMQDEQGRRLAFTGTPRQVADDIKAFEDVGVSSLIVPMKGSTVDEMLGSMDRFQRQGKASRRRLNHERMCYTKAWRSTRHIPRQAPPSPQSTCPLRSTVRPISARQVSASARKQSPCVSPAKYEMTKMRQNATDSGKTLSPGPAYGPPAAHDGRRFVRLS